uniref:hypothetical protein n=1 Tax=Ningiella ruwaisensis TaxID=2364274 RepID=UPI00109FE5FF|nr:hypothetical protein [Ningiella ruwaisensis]
MFKRNQLYIALVATSLSLGASQAFAQESVNSVATVTVSNAFTLQEVAPIDFGTYRVQYAHDGTNDFTTGASAEIFANGNPADLVDGVDGTGTSEASFVEILAGAPAEYAITGAAPFTALKVSALPTATLTNPASPGATFTLSVAATNFEIVGGTNDGDAYDQSGTSNMITDATGAVGFKMGGKITTALTDVTYGDGAYSGSYTVTVDY